MHSEQGSLLVVDDDASNRALLRHSLEARGFAVTDAPDGVRALELIGEQHFDLVLLDVLMPRLSGLEVLKNLRQTYSVTDLPVIMATAKDQSTDVVEALRLGANDYVTKPFDFPVVLARVETQWSLKRSVDRISSLEQSLAQQNAELAEVNRRMRYDLEAAARVQQALLPAALPHLPGVCFAWEFRPCTELAGDLLNVIALDERRVGLYVLDVVGHGVKAALLAVMVSRVLGRLLSDAKPGQPAERLLGSYPLSPAEVAAHLNGEFPWNEGTQQFFTLLYGVLDRDTGEFRFVSAGHPGPLYLPKGTEARVLQVSGSPIGLGDGNYEEHSLILGEGDRLYLYSDGLLDVMDADDKRFGMDGLRAALEEGRTKPLRDGLANLMQRLGEWCGRPTLLDDISILAAEVIGQQYASGQS
jgi:sigma-B regulation protein RsbU (phosphoserine phosphatase)